MSNLHAFLERNMSMSVNSHQAYSTFIINVCLQYLLPLVGSLIDYSNVDCYGFIVLYIFLLFKTPTCINCNKIWYQYNDLAQRYKTTQFHAKTSWLYLAPYHNWCWSCWSLSTSVSVSIASISGIIVDNCCVNWQH